MPKLTVIDVGHGSAAVLEDAHGIVAVDTGRGSQLLDFLRQNNVAVVEALILSHADADHIGGAATLLTDDKIKVERLFANSDATKGSDAWLALIAAIALATCENRLDATIGVHVGTKLRKAGAEAELDVIYPPPAVVMAGAGTKAAPNVTSNSMSVALRIKFHGKPAVVLGGDVEFSCVDYWKNQRVDATAHVAIFPHHGGAPGADNASLFAFEASKLIAPTYVVFSIHETQFDLPRADVIAGVLKANGATQFVCTRLPEKIRKLAIGGDASWKWHLTSKQGQPRCQDGHIVIEPDGNGVKVTCKPSSR